MRLFLSSQDFGKYGKLARELVGENNNAAFIKNAQDDKTSEERNFSTASKKQMFENFGFKFEEIDLRNYFGKSNKLKIKIASFGSVWCAGGNTFILRRAMHASGLDKILKELLDQDKIAYGGWSAGACIVADSLKGIQYGDRPSPSIVPASYPIKKTIWSGLGLVDFIVIPHCNMDWFVDSAKRAEAYFKLHNQEYKKLNDGQVIIINGNDLRLHK